MTALYGVSGTGTRLDASPTESGENIAKLTVVMEGGGSEELEAELTETLRGAMAGQPNAQLDFSRPELFSLSTPLEIELQGADLPQIEAAGRKLAAMLRNNPHYADVTSTVEQGFPEIQIRFDQDRAAALGLTTRQIADVVVKKVRGEVATRYSFRDRKIDVLVRAQATDRASVEDIRNLIVNPNSSMPGAPVVGGRRRRGRRPERNPPRRPGARGHRLGEPARHRPRHRRAGSAADGRRRRRSARTSACTSAGRAKNSRARCVRWCSRSAWRCSWSTW